jgi:hypothetical protein
MPHVHRKVDHGHAASAELTLDLVTARQCGRELPDEIHGHAHFAKDHQRDVAWSAVNVRLADELR